MPRRQTSHISRKAATTLLHSARTAATIGRPFNVVVCISTWALEIDEEIASDSFRQMRRQKFGRWSSYKPRATGIPKNGCPVDTWEIEAPNGRHHVHWMLNIRPENRAEFERKLVKWVRDMAGLSASEDLPEGAVHVTTVANAEGKKLYMAKGTDPLYARLWGITPVDCGTVYGRRAGTALALGPAVWKPFKRYYQLHGRPPTTIVSRIYHDQRRRC